MARISFAGLLEVRLVKYRAMSLRKSGGSGGDCGVELAA